MEYTLMQLMIPYTVGTVLGLYWGTKHNSRRIADATIDFLIKEGFVKYKLLQNGEVELLPLKESQEDAL